MSFWTDLETFAEAKIQELKAEIVKIAPSIKVVVLADAKEVAEAAVQAVITQAPLVLSGAEKLSAATSSVVSTVTTNGKSVLASTAETAVQTAFNLISASLAPSK